MQLNKIPLHYQAQTGCLLPQITIDLLFHRIWVKWKDNSFLQSLKMMMFLVRWQYFCSIIFIGKQLLRYVDTIEASILHLMTLALPRLRDRHISKCKEKKEMDKNLCNIEILRCLLQLFIVTINVFVLEILGYKSIDRS